MANKKKARKQDNNKQARRPKVSKNLTSPKPEDREPVDRPHPNRLEALRNRGTILSQEMVGKLIGCNASTVSRDESGTSIMSRERIQAYALLYRVPTYEIFIEPENPNAPPERLGDNSFNTPVVALPSDFQAPGGPRE